MLQCYTYRYAQNHRLHIGDTLRTKEITARVIPIVIGVFEAASSLTECLALLRVMTRKIGSMQKTAVLGSPHILKKVLGTLTWWY